MIILTEKDFEIQKHSQKKIYVIKSTNYNDDVFIQFEGKNDILPLYIFTNGLVITGKQKDGYGNLIVNIENAYHFECSDSKIKKISIANDIISLDLHNSTVKIIDSLGDIKILNVVDCPNIKDISAGKIEKVEGDYEIKPPENPETFELDL